MADPYVSMDGTVYTDNNILHPDPRRCPHSNAHACVTCDFDGYYVGKYGSVVLWSRDRKEHRGHL